MHEGAFFLLFFVLCSCISMNLLRRCQGEEMHKFFFNSVAVLITLTLCFSSFRSLLALQSTPASNLPHRLKSVATPAKWQLTYFLSVFFPPIAAVNFFQSTISFVRSSERKKIAHNYLRDRKLH